VGRRRSRTEAEHLVAAYESSGLSRDEFCRQQGLSLATLARYRKRQRQTQGEAAGNRWLAVEVSGVSAAVGSGTTSGLAIALPGASSMAKRWCSCWACWSVAEDVRRRGIARSGPAQQPCTGLIEAR
jgi:hypothetical protein